MQSVSNRTRQFEGDAYACEVFKRVSAVLSLGVYDGERWRKNGAGEMVVGNDDIDTACLDLFNGLDARCAVVDRDSNACTDLFDDLLTPFGEGVTLIGSIGNVNVDF